MRRRRIGILIKDVEGFYHHVLWRGFEKSAAMIGADLVCIAGGSPLSSRSADVVTARYLYGLSGLKELDGLVVVGTTVCQNMSGPETKAFLDRFDMPLVHIGLPIEGHPSVMIDPEAGMAQAVRHMVEHHRMERFGVIAGMEYDLESMPRIAAIRRTLSDYGLEIQPENIVHGSFTIESGRMAVRGLCDDGRLRVQCIFSGNDQMAIGALYTLKEMGIDVPRDAALVGFDDVDHLNGLIPPLTTIRQPLREQAEAAIGMLVRLMDGGIAENESLKTELLIRESCGCPSNTLDVTGERPEDFVSRKARSSPPLPAEEIEESLSKSGSDGGKEFLELVQQNLRSMESEDDILVWRAILDNLSSRNQTSAGTSGAAAAEMKALLHRASDLVTRRVLSLEAKDFWDIMDIDWRQKLSVLEDIMNSTNYEDLYLRLEKSCPVTGIKLLRIVRYEKDGEEEKQQLVVSYPDTGNSNRKVDCLTDLLPSGNEEFSGNVLVKLLQFRNEVFGYLMMDVGSYRWLWYENLRAGISSALNGIAQIRKIEQARKELKASYMILEETQRKLSRTEYLASLGLMIRGLAHEINGPVGSSLTAITHVRNMLAPETSQETKRLIDIAVENMEATGNIIKRLKEILGDDRHGTRENFRLHDVINRVFRNSGWGTPGQGSYTVSGMDGTITDADPGDLAAILEELIENTAVHGLLDGGNLPAVSVETAVDDGQLLISYEDDGKGIGDGEIEKLTDPFYTTARSTGGKGLGLAVVRSIVENKNDGTLLLEAKDSGGLRILINLPWALSADS